MWRCPSCKNKIEKIEDRCGACGYERTSDGQYGRKSNNSQVIIAVIASLVILISISVLVFTVVSRVEDLVPQVTVNNVQADPDPVPEPASVPVPQPVNPPPTEQQPVDDELIVYVCYDAPTNSTLADEVTTVTTIEAMGARIIRWTDRDTFLRQNYIDHYWGHGWDLSDNDIRDWFEGPFNVMGMHATYWRLIELTDEYVITDFIWDYQNMNQSDIDLIWQGGNFSRVHVIIGLRMEGATCIRQ